MGLLLLISAYLVGSTALAILVGKAIARRDAPLASRGWLTRSASRSPKPHPGSRTTTRDEFIVRRRSR